MTMKRILRPRTLALLVMGLLLCLAGLFWPASAKQRQFTVAVNIWPGAEGLLSARQSATFKDVPVSLIEFSWSAAVLGAFQKRVVDAAVISLDELLRLDAGDAQPQAVLVVGVSKGSDAIFARPGISDVAGLRGKRVGVELHSAGEYLLLRALQEHGLSLDDVQIVALNLAETESAYLERDLDAVVTADPWRARLAEKGAVLLADSSRMGLEMCRVLVVRRDVANKYQDEIQRLVAVSLDHANGVGPCWEDQGLAAVLRREDLSREQWQAALRLIHSPGLDENRALLSGGLTETLRPMADRMRKAGWLGNDIDVTRLTTDEFVKEDR